jgi:hypothetical protein
LIDDYDDDLMMIFDDDDLLMYGCKYLMMQMVGLVKILYDGWNYII